MSSNEELVYYIYNMGGGLYPLDWEVCFLNIDEYKAKIKEKYQKNVGYNDFKTGGLDVLYSKIDTALSYAMKDFKADFEGYPDKLRCPPMIMPIPRGDETFGAEFIIILKRDEDGDTLIYSPFPLPHLEY